MYKNEMKPIKLYEEWLLESISHDEVKKLQGIGYMSSDIFFGGTDKPFEIKMVKIRDITINGKKPGLTLNFYRRNGMDEDVSIVNKLIRMYKEGRINPIVLTKDLDIMDGIHRYVAQKEMGLREISAYVQTS
jgi:hypothetical protein